MTTAEDYEHALKELVKAAQLAERCFKEALPKFNWGASFLDASAVDLLNRAPPALFKALEQFEPHMESEDPRDMGWVDDRGQP